MEEIISIQFYDLKNKSKIGIPIDRIKKVKYEKLSSKGKDKVITYYLRGEQDNRIFTKFINKKDWESLQVPEINKAKDKDI